MYINITIKKQLIIDSIFLKYDCMDIKKDEGKYQICKFEKDL